MVDRGPCRHSKPVLASLVVLVECCWERLVDAVKGWLLSGCSLVAMETHSYTRRCSVLKVASSAKGIEGAMSLPSHPLTVVFKTFSVLTDGIALLKRISLNQKRHCWNTSDSCQSTVISVSTTGWPLSTDNVYMTVINPAFHLITVLSDWLSV